MGHHHHHTNQAGKNLGVAFVLNVSFTIIELIGGYLTNSVAIMADALHDLGDSTSLGIAWYLEILSRKPSDDKFTFGYRRYSLLGAVITGAILVAGSLIIVREAVPRLFSPESVDPKGMFALAILGVIVNGAAVLRLKSGESLNEKMVSWHLMEDVLGWVAVLFVSIVIYFYDVPILDPILSILITLYILRGVLINLKKAMDLFLQGVPSEIDIHSVRNAIINVDGVAATHHMHVWSQDGENHVMTTHAVLDKGLSSNQTKSIRVEIKSVASEFGISHCTVEIENGPQDCTDSILED